jgi:hypothetical protein
MHTKIVTVFLTGCALVSCADVQQAPDLIGKSLILETDRAQNYDFITSHEVRRTRERRPSGNGILSRETTHLFNPVTGEFYEETSITHTEHPVPDGYAYTRWQLNFTAPDKGTATLIKKHPRALRSHKIGYTVPFRTEKLPELKLTDFPSKQAESLAIKLLQEHRKLLPTHTKLPTLVRLHQWDSIFLTLELSHPQRQDNSTFAIFTASPFGIHTLNYCLHANNTAGDKLHVSQTGDNGPHVQFLGKSHQLPPPGNTIHHRHL